MNRKKVSMLLTAAMAMGCTGINTSALAESEPVKLVFTTVGTETDHTTPVYQSMVDEFNATNEYGVEIEVQFYENEQYKTKLTTLMAANDIPDLFMTYELEYNEPFVKAGKVADITAYLEEDQDWKNSFQGGTLELLMYDGKNYGIPTQKCANIVYYNTAIFEEQGLSVPTTIDEFMDVCAKLTENGIVPMSISGEGSWRVSQFVQEIAASIGGVELYNGIRDGSRNWNDEANIKSGTIFQEMVNNGYFNENFMSTLGDEAIQIFGRGETAMYYNGIWDMNAVDATDVGQAGNVDVFMFPGETPDLTSVCVGSVNYSFSVGADCENVDAVVAFLKYMTSDEVALKFLYEEGAVPITNCEVDESRLSDLMNKCLNISSEMTGLTPWWDRAFADVGVEYNNTIVAIANGDAPQDAFDYLNEYALSEE